MLQRIELKHIGPFEDVGVEFAPRLNLITGDNSVGKSLVLEAAWWALSGMWLAPPAPPASRTKEVPLVRGRLEYLSGPAGSPEIEPTREKIFLYNSDNRPVRGPVVIHARPNGEFAVWDPSQHAKGVTDPEGTFHRFYDFAPRRLWNGTPFCKGLLADLTTWFYKQSAEWRILGKVLEVLSPDGDERLVLGEPMRLAVGDPREVPSLEMPYDTVPITLASAGVNRILSLAYILVWAWSEHLQAARIERDEPSKHMVLLLDEVDAHLHPRWQRTILPSVLRVVTELQADIAVQVLATTHAPLVLASAEPLFDEDRDRLFHLELQGRTVQMNQLDWARRGEVSSWLQSEVFGLDEARSLPGEQAIEAALAALGDPTVTEAQLEEHELALAGVIGELDPVWVRWKWLRRERKAAK